MATANYVNSGAVNGGSAAASSIQIASYTHSGNLLLVFVSYRGADNNVTGIKWNTTESLTLLAVQESATSETAVEIWYLKSATPTTANIDITLGGNQYLSACCMSLANADVSGTTFGSTASISGTSSGATVDVTAVAGDLIIDVVGKKYTDITDGALVAGAGQTSRQTAKSTNGTDSNNVYMGISTEVATGATTTMSWTWTSGSRYRALIGVAVKGKAPTGGVIMM